MHFEVAGPPGGEDGAHHDVSASATWTCSAETILALAIAAASSA